MGSALYATFTRNLYTQPLHATFTRNLYTQRCLRNLYTQPLHATFCNAKLSLRNPKGCVSDTAHATFPRNPFLVVNWMQRGGRTLRTMGRLDYRTSTGQVLGHY
jgi:hypothetical protein